MRRPIRSMRRRMWRKILEALFDLPASVVIILGKGEVWKVGKTDFALKIVESLLEYHIIDKFASNINVKGDRKNGKGRWRREDFHYITDIPNLKHWMFRDRQPKVFINDEALSTTPSRRAMSKLNVKWLEVIPQLSKGNCKLIVISQTEQYLESVFYNPIFLRGVIEKVSLTKAVVRSPLIENGEVFIDHIPRTTFKFDPYEIATFTAEGKLRADSTDDEMNMVLEWVSHGNMQQVARDRKLHYQQVKRIILAKLRAIFTSQELLSKDVQNIPVS